MNDIVKVVLFVGSAVILGSIVIGLSGYALLGAYAPLVTLPAGVVLGFVSTVYAVDRWLV